MNKDEQKTIATNSYNLSKKIKTLQKQQETLKKEESNLKEEVLGLMEELRVKKIKFKELNISIAHPIAEVDPGILRMEYPYLAKKFVEEKIKVFISPLSRKILKSEYPETFKICKADDPTSYDFQIYAYQERFLYLIFYVVVNRTYKNPLAQ